GLSGLSPPSYAPCVAHNLKALNQFKLIQCFCNNTSISFSLNRFLPSFRFPDLPLRRAQSLALPVPLPFRPELCEHSRHAPAAVLHKYLGQTTWRIEDTRPTLDPAKICCSEYNIIPTCR